MLLQMTNLFPILWLTNIPLHTYLYKIKIMKKTVKKLA